MPNYQEGKIYKIYNAVNDDIYVGSTTRKLSERMAEHRKPYNIKRHENLPIYKAFIEFGVESFFIELIEKCPCNDKEELRKKEGEYIRQLKPSLNKFIAGRTNKEWMSDNKEHSKQQQKEYREANKEHRAQITRMYYQNNKDSLLPKNKLYYDINQEDIKKQKKQYYDINKEKVLEPIKCECGCIVIRNGIPRHKRSTKHNQLMKDKLN